MPRRPQLKRKPLNREYGPQAHARIQSATAVLSRQLQGCTRQEIEMLIRFYVRGQEEVAILDDTGATVEDFRKLRSRMRQSVARIRNGNTAAAKAGAGR